jgi:hypothetical protein
MATDRKLIAVVGVAISAHDSSRAIRQVAARQRRQAMLISAMGQKT